MVRLWRSSPCSPAGNIMATAQKSAGEGLGAGLFQDPPPLCMWEAAGSWDRLQLPPQARWCELQSCCWCCWAPPGLPWGGRGRCRMLGSSGQPSRSLGGGQSQRVSASPAPPPGHGTDRPVCVHPLPAPALTHSHCCGQVSAQGQHIKDTALLFTTLSPLPKTPLGAPHLCRP